MLLRDLEIMSYMSTICCYQWHENRKFEPKACGWKAQEIEKRDSLKLSQDEFSVG